VSNCQVKEGPWGALWGALGMGGRTRRPRACGWLYSCTGVPGSDGISGHRQNAECSGPPLHQRTQNCRMKGFWREPACAAAQPSVALDVTLAQSKAGLGCAAPGNPQPRQRKPTGSLQAFFHKACVRCLGRAGYWSASACCLNRMTHPKLHACEAGGVCPGERE